MQVNHVPIVVAVHAEGRGWTYSANDWFHMALRPNSATFRPVGDFFVRFADGDEYVWDGVRFLSSRLLYGDCKSCVIARHLILDSMLATSPRTACSPAAAVSGPLAVRPAQPCSRPVLG